MFYSEDEFEDILQAVVLVPYSPGYKLGDFYCGTKDYNEFLTNDAEYYVEQNISQVRLLLHKQTADVIAYMALSITQNPETPSFYEKNGFVYNEKENRHRTRAISMRYDVFQS